MNKIKINLKDFQSIKEAELEFIQGINLIVGEGNSGKSATLRAVKGVILNPKGSQKYIKKGSEGLSVNIQYQGNDITWSRTSKDIKYEINGEEYQKVGNSSLPKIIDKSGFVIDENNKLMNVEGELELPFPFDKNPADLFKLFEKSIFCVSDSALILKTIKADEDTAKKEETDAEYELNRYEKKLKALEELEEVIDLDKLKEGKVKIEELYFQLDKLKENCIKITKGIEASKSLKNFREEVNIVDVNSYSSLYKDVEKLHNIEFYFSILSPTHEEIEIKDLFEYEKLQGDINKLEEINELLSKTKQLEELSINVDLSSYEKKLNDFKNLGKIVKKYKELTKEVAEMKDIQNKLKKELSAFKTCPLCGNKLGEN